MSNFKSEVVRTNIQSISKKQKVYLKDTSDAVKLDDVVKVGEAFILTPEYWAEVHVENDKTEDKEYMTYIVIDVDGTKYVTGSETFWRSFLDIAEEMDGDEYSVKVFKRPSKNYSGNFITCSLVM